MSKAIDLGDFFCVKADNRELNYEKYISTGSKKIALSESYTSHNS